MWRTNEIYYNIFFSDKSIDAKWVKDTIKMFNWEILAHTSYIPGLAQPMSVTSLEHALMQLLKLWHLYSRWELIEIFYCSLTNWWHWFLRFNGSEILKKSSRAKAQWASAKNSIDINFAYDRKNTKIRYIVND